MSDGNNMNDFEVLAVADGEVVLLDKLDDQIFAQRMIGDGFALRPTGTIVYSPVDAIVGQLAPTKHAVYLSLSDDVKLLIHVGLDTIEMKGEGFETTITKGMHVKRGDPLIQFDSKLIRDEGFDPVIAVVLLVGSEHSFDLTIFPTEGAEANKTLAMHVETKE